MVSLPGVRRRLAVRVRSEDTGRLRSEGDRLPLVTDGDTALVVHARAGVGVALGPARRHLLSVDAGGWWGVHHASRTDVAGVETRSSARVLRPMAGLSYFYAF
jgi:hypothetical protein